VYLLCLYIHDKLTNLVIYYWRLRLFNLPLNWMRVLSVATQELQCWTLLWIVLCSTVSHCSFRVKHYTCLPSFEWMIYFTTANFITRMFRENQKASTSSLLFPHILLSTLSSNTVDHVSDYCKRSCCSILYICSYVWSYGTILYLAQWIIIHKTLSFLRKPENNFIN
jgi:hypothetical protein